MTLTAHAGPDIADRYSYEAEYATESASDSLIVTSINLQLDAELARSKGLPLLVEFSAPWCSYCAALEENVLEPLLRSKDYGESMVLRKLEINGYSGITDIDGRQMRSDALARRYRVGLYPTLLMFDTHGREVMRVVGITMLEYVNQQLEAALLLQRVPVTD